LSKYSVNAQKRTRASTPLSKDGIYGIALAVLACLLVSSLFTQGFGLIKAQGQACPQITCPACPTCPSANATAHNATTGTKAATAPPQQAVQAATPPVPKTDRPQVEVFVMSYCPFGLQMEKAVVPVMELLGARANITMEWVYYSMHGQNEVQENTRQHCIQSQQADKFTKYLRCFVASTNTTQCQQQAGIDTAKLDACYNATDKEFGIMASFDNRSSWLNGYYPLYNVNLDENQKYGVRGSPTLVINGQTASVTRSAEAVKEAICNAFNTPPSECGTALSASAEAAGAGPIGAAGGTAAGSACG
jgi:glutaredoxin